jgi:hypothetical protein
MPLFFFHLRGGAEGLNLDQDGLDLPNVEAAYLEAHQTALDMTQEWLRKRQNPRGYAFEIMSATGEVVVELPFSEALDRQAGRRPANLPRAIKMAIARGDRMKRLSAELAEQVWLVQENLRRSQDLLNSLGKGRAG